MEIEVFERAKEILNQYHNLDLERMAVADALAELAEVAENMADVLTDIVYSE